MARVAEFAKLTENEANLLRLSLAGSLDPKTADGMVENVIGTYALPLGLATNFIVNGRELLVPMVTEEPSVVAAASNGAKMARAAGGFTAHASAPLMVGQIFLRGVKDLDEAAEDILRRKGEVLHAARISDSALERQGAGPIDVETRTVRIDGEDMLCVNLVVDCADAMGANAVNTRCERVAPFLQKLTGGKASLRILSNLADRRLVRAKAVFEARSLGGRAAVDQVLHVAAIAEADVYRCVTHNKGVMNGVDAVVTATGNDTRAVEAGAHAFAAKSGTYEPLTRYSADGDGNLVGEIELPMPVGIVGGATRAHPLARLAVKILGVESAVQLAEVIASVGLAQNLAALRALAREGIQRGHMSLHTRVERN